MVTKEQALKALDDMDDFARMNCGINAIGARSVLERFINEQKPPEKASLPENP